MRVVRNIGGGIIYVGFPAAVIEGSSMNALVVQQYKEFDDWLKEHNITPEFGFTAGKKTGLFLAGEDAIAFKLRFSGG